MHAVIVSNGFPPSKKLLESEIEKADLVIGADGGGNIILKHGISPDIVIGDLDSFVKPDNLDFDLIHDKDQETNDLEKALSLVREKKAETCTVLGAFGKRMDHALKNLSVMKKFQGKFEELIFKDDQFEAFFVDERYHSELKIGSVVSLFPLSGEVTGITTTGLKYPLDNETLKNGERDGTSNEAIETEISVSIKSGDLVLFVER